MEELEKIVAWETGEKNKVPVMRDVSLSGFVKLSLKYEAPPLAIVAMIGGVALLLLGMGLAGLPPLLIFFFSFMLTILGVFFVVKIPKKYDYGQTLSEIVQGNANKKKIVGNFRIQ